jgi:hypothetical protein
MFDDKPPPPIFNSKWLIRPQSLSQPYSIEIDVMRAGRQKMCYISKKINRIYIFSVIFMKITYT